MIDILQYLPTGNMENAISQSALAALLRVDKRTVRALVYRARCKNPAGAGRSDGVVYYRVDCSPSISRWRRYRLGMLMPTR